MQELLREYLNEIGSKQKKRKRFSIVAAVFAVAVVGTVIWGLARAGIATTGEAKCGKEEHTHTEACYGSTLACGQEENGGHTHTEACYQTVSNLVCGLEESEEHAHTEECYQTETVLVCGQEEYAGHTHSDACYTKDLACGLEEHAHTEGCYIDTSADVEEPASWAAQYESVEWKETWNEDLVIAAQLQLDYKESVENYIVAEDGSHKGYTRYGQFADERYIDWDASFVNFCMYYAGLTSSEMFPKEKTTQKWYDSFVQVDEGKNKVYLTAPEGYEPEAGDIIFLKNENKETDFQMGIVSSYDKEKNEVKVIEGNSDNKVQENTYDIADTHISEYLKISEMERAYKNQDSETEEEAGTDAAEPSFVTETEESEETPEEEDAGEEVSGEEVSAETIEKVYTSDDFIVTASYTAEANIPEEAELIAEKVTPEADEAHYAEREAEFKEMAKNEDAVMKALLKIGFYVDGAEVEPESTVTITVQFLDEQGLAEGKPITIVHFADGGTEVLDGGRASDNSTTFQTESFSEYAIGEGIESETGKTKETIYVSEAFDYENDAFRITFQIDGDAILTGKIIKNTEDKIEKNFNDVKKGNIEEEGTDSGIGGMDDEDSADGGNLEEDETEDSADGGNLEEGKAEDSGNGQDVFDEVEGDVSSDTNAENVNDTISGDKEIIEKDGFRLEVEKLRPDSERYKAFSEFAAATDQENEEFLLDVMEYKLFYEEVELDLSECEIIAKIIPLKTAEEYLASVGVGASEAENDVESVTGKEVQNLSAVFSSVSQISRSVGAVLDNANTSEETEVIEAEAPKEVIFTAYGQERDDIYESNKIIVADETRIGDETAEPELIIELRGYSLGVRGSNTPNRSFKVQYYANLQIVDTTATGQKQLNVIDTSNGGNNQGGKLPENGKAASTKTKQIAVGNDMKIITKTELTKVYADSGQLYYYTSPSLDYFNALKDNEGYRLKEVWILKAGKSNTSINESDWHRYNYDTDLHFTNRRSGDVEGEVFELAEAFPDAVTTEEEKNRYKDTGLRYVLIGDNAVIRLVYDPTTGTPEFDSNFYDYDISTEKPTTSGGTQIMKTSKYGINSDSNYSGSGIKYAFGNKNAGTDYGALTWANPKADTQNLLNAGNKPVNGGSDTYGGCTFKLVTGMTGNMENVVFNSGINGIDHLFGDGDLDNDKKPKGKKGYDGKLGYTREGDTYTFSTATVNMLTEDNKDVTLSGLNKFQTHSGAWSNNFWPMDKAGSSKRNDFNFGKKPEGTQKFQRDDNTINNLPLSDDGTDHNSYFGMRQQIKFNLPKDYVGPLEYYFFGDDDMWVFLDDRLICDIGGVHSAVGEYVNLWDYLAKGSSGTHTLTFFYTERGASGSCCWMQFTLPEVTGGTTLRNSELCELKIQKQVLKYEENEQGVLEGKPYGDGGGFEFVVKLRDKDGTLLPDDYSFTKYDVKGAPIPNSEDIILHSGSKFELNNGEYILIKNLPPGTKYEIEEKTRRIPHGGIDYSSKTDISETKYQWIYPDDGQPYRQLLAGSQTDPNPRNILDSQDVAINNQFTVLSGSNDVVYTNSFTVYRLPSTGGPGIYLYMFSGVLIISASALMTYRKKRKGVLRS